VLSCYLVNCDVFPLQCICLSFHLPRNGISLLFYGYAVALDRVGLAKKEKLMELGRCHLCHQQ
jgi:hypothetical protein